MSKYQYLPPLSVDEYARLKADIATNGILVPPVEDQDGEIVDGHHRIEIANELGVKAPEPVRQRFDDDLDREAFVYRINEHRRHLSPEQRREVAERRQAMAQMYRQRGLTQDETAERLGVSQDLVSLWERGESNRSDTNARNTSVPDLRLSVPKAERMRMWERRGAGETYAEIAADYKVTPERVSQIVRQVEAALREPEPVETPGFPGGPFRCLIIDPPWSMPKIEREVRPNQGAVLDYPTMSLDEIAELPIPALADERGCHLYLWVTHKFLPAGLDLVERWGFRYQCLMTWVKNVGPTPFSWMYSTEHVVFARSGSLDLERLGLRLDFQAPVTRHSAKPDVFYERVVEASPEPRLELFARQPRDGFEVWGNEVTA